MTIMLIFMVFNIGVIMEHIAHNIHNPFTGKPTSVDIYYYTGVDEHGLFDIIIDDIVTETLESLMDYLDFNERCRITTSLYERLKKEGISEK